MRATVRRVLAALVVASVALGATWTPVRADQSERFHYVAGEGSGGVLDPHDSPVGTVAPAGYHEFVAAGSAVSLHVDDRLAVDGREIPVWVTQGKRTLFWGCMPVRNIVTLSGASPGRPVFIRIGDEFIDDLPSCSAKATTGVVTISGVLAR